MHSDIGKNSPMHCISECISELPCMFIGENSHLFLSSVSLRILVVQFRLLFMVATTKNVKSVPPFYAK